MKFTCTIDLDNAAFEESPTHLGHILMDIGEHLKYEGIQPTEATIHDFNGNTIGSWRIEAS